MKSTKDKTDVKTKANAEAKIEVDTLRQAKLMQKL